MDIKYSKSVWTSLQVSSTKCLLSTSVSSQCNGRLMLLCWHCTTLYYRLWRLTAYTLYYDLLCGVSTLLGKQTGHKAEMRTISEFDALIIE